MDVVVISVWMLLSLVRVVVVTRVWMLLLSLVNVIILCVFLDPIVSN